MTAVLSRQSMYSIDSWKTSSQKLLSTFSNKKFNIIDGRHQPSIAALTTRFSSSAAVDQSGHRSGGHNHSKLWSLERYLSIGLLAVIPASFAVTSPAMDYLLALSLVTHVHWGIEAIVVDYIRPSIFGRVIPKLAVVYVYVLSMIALSGLFYFNYTDVGLTTAIRMVAKI